MDPADGEISIICEVCGSELVPRPWGPRADGGLRCRECPAAQWEVE